MNSAEILKDAYFHFYQSQYYNFQGKFQEVIPQWREFLSVSFWNPFCTCSTGQVGEYISFFSQFTLNFCVIQSLIWPTRIWSNGLSMGNQEPCSREGWAEWGDTTAPADLTSAGSSPNRCVRSLCLNNLGEARSEWLLSFTSPFLRAARTWCLETTVATSPTLITSPSSCSMRSSTFTFTMTTMLLMFVPLRSGLAMRPPSWDLSSSLKHDRCRDQARAHRFLYELVSI